MQSLDPAGPILAALFDAPESDTVIKAVDSAGLRVDWTLDESRLWTHKTRKRKFRVRVSEAMGRLASGERMKFLSRLVAALLQRELATVDQLNGTLASIGWLYEDELIPLVSGPTALDAAEPVQGQPRTAVIVTALELEANAVKEHLADVREDVHEKGTVYFVGRFDGGVEWRVAVVIAGQGNPTAAAEVERAVTKFKPAVILLVGVAGALKDLDLGDVVAADKVYGYERGKAAEEFLARPAFGVSTYAAIQRARAEASKDDWIQRIKAPVLDSHPRAVVAPIAAGEKVVASMESPEFQILRKFASDAVAVEMEGVGFLSGAHLNHGVQALVVRGISDLVDGKAAADAAGSQPRAARHAAAFAFEFLANFLRRPDHADSREENSRRRELDRRLSESRARAIARWQGAGLPPEVAMAFADDEFVAGSEPAWRPRATRPFVVLLAEFGAGKSMRTEYLYQLALKRHVADSTSPIPLYLELSPGKIPSLSDIRAAAAAFGDIERNGAAVFIERADEGGHSHAFDCLAFGRRLVHALDRTTVLMPSRPLSTFAEIPEAADLPELSEPEACALISRVAGHEVRSQDLLRWSESVQAALRRPLFAILVGLYLQNERANGHSLSVGELINYVVVQAIQRTRSDLGSAERLLAILGARAVDQGGGFVPYVEVGALWEIGQLLSSGLVTRRGDEVGFAIPVIGQWFAAHALRNGLVRPDDVLLDASRRDRWRYSLSIVAAVFDGPFVDAIFERLATSDPGLLALVLKDGVGHGMRTNHGRQPEAVEYESRLQLAWRSSVASIGDLGAVVGACDREGRSYNILARAGRDVLTVGWYPAHLEIEASGRPGAGLPPGWMKSVQAGHPSGRSAWCWQFILDRLKNGVQDALRRRALSSDDACPLAVEVVWCGALALTKRGSLHPGPIPLDEIERALDRLSPGVSHVHAYDCGSIDLRLVRCASSRLRASGATELASPLPTHDIESPQGNWVWSAYSDSRLLQRTQVVYELALNGYEYIVSRFFPKFRHRLSHAVTLPATFKGVLSTCRPGETDPSRFPGLDYAFELLPEGVPSRVEIVLAPAPGFVEADFNEMAWERARRMRSSASDWIVLGTGATVLDVFGTCPATQIALAWLGNDLRQLNWA